MDVYGIIRVTLAEWEARYGDSDEDDVENAGEIAWIQQLLEEGVQWDAC